jgi:cytidyltransferase-like protein
MKPNVYLSGGFDDLRSEEVRLLQQASTLGKLTLFLWTDEVFQHFRGHSPKFPFSERLYMLQAIRYVDHVERIDSLESQDILPVIEQPRLQIWVVSSADDNNQKRQFCEENHIDYRVIQPQQTDGFPLSAGELIPSKRKRVVVTGCFDWLHSGHIRFFEEVSAYGDLYVVVGNDENVRLLKGEGHPMLSQQERLYMVQSVRYVSVAMLSSGFGWLDAKPEIACIKPDYYVVNEDGDQPEKRAFCEKQGIEYIVLKRAPKKGLPARNSTNLRSTARVDKDH